MNQTTDPYVKLAFAPTQDASLYLTLKSRGSLEPYLTPQSPNTHPPSLDDLPHLTREPLACLWVELLHVPVPKSLSLPLMRRFVAYALQARAHGDLPDGFVASLTKRAAVASRTKPPPARLRLGGRLLREWNGITHVVDIVEGGLIWRGEPYASLSAIAKAITGAHWSGPRFFGLTAPAETGTTKQPRATGGAHAGRHAEPRQGKGACRPATTLDDGGASEMELTGSRSASAAR